MFKILEKNDILQSVTHRLKQNFNETNPFEDDGALCNRPCTDSEKPKICYYYWILEFYTALGS